MDTIKVICGIIYKGEEIFIVRRREGKSLAGYWEFPGGKIENGEDHITALTRELEEELGMQVEVGKRIATNIHAYTSFRIELIAYACNYLSATFEMTDHDAYEWTQPSATLDYDLAPADVPIARQVMVSS